MTNHSGSAGEDIELYRINYTSSNGGPKTALICQGLLVDGETLLWVDGVDHDRPIVVPLAGIPATWCGSYSEWLDKNPEFASQIFDIAPGDCSPTLIARCMSLMTVDPSLDADAAFCLCLEQGKDFIKEDAEFFNTLRENSLRLGN